MELIGKIAEQKGLTGQENLTALVEAFREEKAVLNERLLPKMEKYYCGVISERQEEMTRILLQLLGQVLLPSQVRDVEKALELLAEDYICSEFGMKYDRISPQLFMLRRKIPYTVTEGYRDAKKIEITIPLFAHADLGEDEWKLEKEEIHSLGNGGEYNIGVKSKVPPITKEANEKARQATADYMEICSKALRKPTIGELLSRDLIYGKACLDLQVYWIPCLSELEIEVKKVNRDPLLVAGIYNKKFLVAKWDVLGEEPYEHYLEEFREQKAGK